MDVIKPGAIKDMVQALRAASLEPPTFWTEAPELWFIKIEALFNINKIILDEPKYDYVIRALNGSVTKEVESALLDPPVTNKYENLKTALIKAFGKTQAQIMDKLVNMASLENRTAAAVWREIQSLDDDPDTIKRFLLLACLPREVRKTLAASGKSYTNTDELVAAADAIRERKAFYSRLVQEVSRQPQSSQVPQPQKVFVMQQQRQPR